MSKPKGTFHTIWTHVGPKWTSTIEKKELSPGRAHLIQPRCDFSYYRSVFQFDFSPHDCHTRPQLTNSNQLNSVSSVVLGPLVALTSLSSQLYSAKLEY